jgi:hypothetical protein
VTIDDDDRHTCRQNLDRITPGSEIQVIVKIFVRFAQRVPNTV